MICRWCWHLPKNTCWISYIGIAVACTKTNESFSIRFRNHVILPTRTSH